jgi:hypothetical protein
MSIGTCGQAEAQPQTSWGKVMPKRETQTW